ncbi:azurin [Stenotrophomonas sp. HITSZ_GD]|uniref:azurin n=1 Tax=Stenotrophomonas sp. HITSZ_GD TaxID=3037248 RepID=UPI00240E7FF4|nr:azurin [Stenotrophomonas sp. HITSZ_GD]MDG2526838.1 azurin [Stenotrophomonas sp. HITSZ_GD]
MKFPLALVLCLAGLGAASQASARSCAFTVNSNDQMRFDTAALKVAADCTEVVLTLRHTGTLAARAMGHNWVLTRSADMQAVAMAGMRARLEDDYVPPNDPRVIAHTKVIGGGQVATVRFSTRLLQKGGAYSFFCSFPGHFALMRGTLSFG